LRTLHFVLPGPIDTSTGGYRYDRQMVRELRALRWRVEVHELPAEFPFPSPDALEVTRAVFAAIPDEALVLVDGLAFGVLPELARTQAKRLRLTALVHHPLHEETGLDAIQQQHLFESERRALSLARAVFVTSPATSRSMLASGLVSAPPVVAVPGTTRGPMRTASSHADSRLICVATLTPRKRHALLVDALARARDLPWTLDCVGSLDMHPPTVVALRAQLASHGLEDRVRLLGERPADQLGALYRRADLFVLASEFEGYGMALAEALVQGLPVIATRTGAASDLVRGEAGRLVEPGDLGGLTAALRELLGDPVRRERAASVARDLATTMPRWEDSARVLAAGLQGQVAE
jgi:glycosyltransferase involved in cell wall biosynthesis